jgi:hypothetical protein
MSNPEKPIVRKKTIPIRGEKGKLAGSRSIEGKEGIPSEVLTAPISPVKIEDKAQPKPRLKTMIRMKEVPTPDGCRWCGGVKKYHGRSYTKAAGLHKWESPTDAQRLARMKARKK